MNGYAIAFDMEIDSLMAITSVITELKSIEWFRNSVRDIRVFKIEEWSNFTDFIIS